jgi:hypothetical protein
VLVYGKEYSVRMKYGDWCNVEQRREVTLEKNRRNFPDIFELIDDFQKYLEDRKKG